MSVIKHRVQPYGVSPPAGEEHTAVPQSTQSSLYPLPCVPLPSIPFISLSEKGPRKVSLKKWGPLAWPRVRPWHWKSRHSSRVSSAFEFCLGRRHHHAIAYKELEETSQFQSSINIGDHAFSQMEEDIDRQRLLGGQPSYTRTDPQTASMTSDLQKKERYERLLRRAKAEDLKEISGIGCLYQCGVDKLGRPVVVFIGKWFKFNEINLDKALLYLIYLLDPLVERDYVIIYFHTITSTENHPSMAWIRQAYDVLQYKYKKNLKSFYIIHPTFWTKIMTWWFTTFMAPQIKHKVHSLPGVEYLYDIIEPDQLEIPAYIIEHDMTINGIRYYRPVSS